MDGPQPVPPGVVATPTYVLDGRIISLGNPYRDILVAAILDAHTVPERDHLTGGPSEAQESVQHEHADPRGTIIVYGTAWCGDCRRAKRVLDQRQVPYTWVDIDADRRAEAEVLRLNGGMRSVPTMVFPDGSVLVEPSDRELAARLDMLLRETAPDLAVPPPSGPVPGGWQRQSLAAGIAGSVVASFCCLPTATAIALGLSLGTVARLSQLLAYQRLFQVAGLALAGVAVWWLLRRSQASCTLSPQERERVPLLVFGAFTASFVILNLVVIRFLEHIPDVLAGH
ncbi:MAG: hypothetical protein HY689_03205 [Chloroflexi bacterium]|nr:hypothetical protein [Chloroflexota bacterium]